MKRVSLIFLVMLAVVAFGFVSCVSQPAGSTSEGSSTAASAPPSDMPDFYLNPPLADDAIYGVGSAKMAKLDTSRKMAVARAREDIAFQMNASIKAAITDYAQEAGVDGNNQVISFVETISKQVTQTTLNGAKTEQVAAGKDGTVYALVSYPLNAFKDEVKKEFVRNEDAAFAEFKADQAMQKLDAELSNNPPKSGNVKGE
ncbi:MAG: hypothetical protein E4H36_02730 [Spirochaetales bacterium]|nr:MAG: hypothetical protein E4H36_02730 [Spirochaetales bacterium]